MKNLDDAMLAEILKVRPHMRCGSWDYDCIACEIEDEIRRRAHPVYQLKKALHAAVASVCNPILDSIESLLKRLRLQ